MKYSFITGLAIILSVIISNISFADGHDNPPKAPKQCWTVDITPDHACISRWYDHGAQDRICFPDYSNMADFVLVHNLNLCMEK